MVVKAVVDTNIWISALLNPFGFPAKLRKAFEEGAFIVVISDPLIEELTDVLARPKIKEKYEVTDSDINELLILMEERSEDVLVSGEIVICRDKDDDFVIETAIKGGAAYLVTRDDDIKFDKEVTAFLLQHNVSVVSIAKFLALINIE